MATHLKMKKETEKQIKNRMIYGKPPKFPPKQKFSIISRHQSGLEFLNYISVLLKKFLI